MPDLCWPGCWAPLTAAPRASLTAPSEKCSSPLHGRFFALRINPVKTGSRWDVKMEIWVLKACQAFSKLGFVFWGSSEQSGTSVCNHELLFCQQRKPKHLGMCKQLTHAEIWSKVLNCLSLRHNPSCWLSVGHPKVNALLVEEPNAPLAFGFVALIQAIVCCSWQRTDFTALWDFFGTSPAYEVYRFNITETKMFIGG